MHSLCMLYYFANAAVISQHIDKGNIEQPVGLTFNLSLMTDQHAW